MAADPLTGALEKELASIAVKGATSLIDRGRRWYRSYNLLLVGQERAGKTALYKFLWARFLSKDGEPTTPTVDDVNSGVFRFEWQTSGGTLAVDLRNVGDRSGQIGPHHHANLFIDSKPHLLVVVLDVSMQEGTDRLHGSYERWFEYFCMYVGDRLTNRPRLARRVNSRLFNLIVLLNKADTLAPPRATTTINEATAKLRTTLQTRLRPYFGGKVDSFPILPCSIVSNPQHGSADETIARLRDVIRALMNSTIR